MIFVVVVVGVYCVCGFAHLELLRWVDLQISCVSVWCFASVIMLRVETVCCYRSICRHIQSKIDSVLLAVNCIVHTMKLKY